MHRDAVDIRPRMSISDALGTMMSFTISSRSLVTVSRLHMTRSLGFRNCGNGIINYFHVIINYIFTGPDTSGIGRFYSKSPASI